MKTKYARMLFVLAALTATQQPQAQTRIGLEACKEMAIDNNRKVKNSRLEIKASEQDKKNAFTAYFPSVSVTGMGFKAKDPMLSMNMGGIPIGMLDDGWAGALVLTQPVFAGGKIINANKMAKLGIDINEQQARLSENEVLLRTEGLYWELVALHEKMNTIHILEEQLDGLRKEVEQFYAAGLITLNDVLQVKLSQNKINSNKANLDNGIKLCKMALCQQIGLDINHSETFDVELPEPGEVDSPVVYYVNHREALSIRAESKLLDKNVEATKLQTQIKRADYLPTVAVGATYNQQNMITNKWDGNSAVFMSVSIPVSNWWGGSHVIKKQKINEQIACNHKLEGEEQLLLQMQNVRNELDNSYKLILIARESIEQSTENLRLNNDYYRAGMVNLTDVLDAQTLLQQSRDEYVDAHSNYQKKRFEYMQVTGR